MVTIYGLNARIGNRSYYDSTGDQSFTKPYSEETSRIIDEEVSILIEGAYDRAKDILRTNKEKLEGLAESLLENEVIFKEDLKRILGDRPFASAQEIPVAVPVQSTSTSDTASVEADSTEEVPADDKAVSDEASDLAESSDQSDSSDASAILPSEGA